MTSYMSKKTKNTRAKIDRDVSLLKLFLQRMVEFRNVEEILLHNSMNVLESSPVFTVITKDGNDYEHTSQPQKTLRFLSSSSDKGEPSYKLCYKNHRIFIF